MEQANILVSLRDGHTFEALSVGPMRGKFITFFIPGDRQREVHEDCIRDVEKPSTKEVYDLSAFRLGGSVITTNPPAWEYFPPDPSSYTPDTFRVHDVPTTPGLEPPYNWAVGSHVDAHVAGMPAPMSHDGE